MQLNFLRNKANRRIWIPGLNEQMNIIESQMFKDHVSTYEDSQGRYNIHRKCDDVVLCC